MRIYTRNVEGVRLNINNREIAKKYKDSDVVLLQEVFGGLGANHKRLSEKFVYSHLYSPTWNPFGSGLLVLGHHPAYDVKEGTFPIPGLLAFLSKFDIVPKGYTGIRSWTDIGYIWIFNTHMNSGGTRADALQRRKEVRFLVKELRKIEEPIVIAGDLNLNFGRPDKEVAKMDKATFDFICEKLNLVPAQSYKTDHILISKSISDRLEVGVTHPDDGLSDHVGLEIYLDL